MNPEGIPGAERGNFLEADQTQREFFGDQEYERFREDRQRSRDIAFTFNVTEARRKALVNDLYGHAYTAGSILLVGLIVGLIMALILLGRLTFG